MTPSPSPIRAWVLVGSLAAGLSASQAARAELLDDAERLEAAYQRGGAVVTRLPPRFVLADSAARVLLPNLTTLGSGERPCATVIAMGTRSARFSMRPALPRILGMAAPAVEAEGGIATLEDCRGQALATGVAELIMGKRAGTLEVLVIRHRSGALSAPSVVLPARATGPLPPPEPVGPLQLAPLEQRRQRAEDAARRDGATFVARVDVTSDVRGRGVIVLRLKEGCHRVAVQADASGLAASGSPPVVDVDATIRLSAAGEPLVFDRSHAPDARLDFCLGITRDVQLHFVGAGGAVPVVVTTSYWGLPPGLPDVWGEEARAGFAWALQRRPSPRVDRAPDLLLAGASGVTETPVAVEPESCYLAALALTQGMSAGVRLTARVGVLRRHDDGTGGQAAAAVSFCTGAADRLAALQVDVRSQTAWWGLALWRVGDAP